MLPAVGSHFGRWVVVGTAQHRNGRVAVACRCDCGTERDVLVQSLRRKDRANPSCGCWKRERTATIIVETRWKASHGYASKKDRHPLYGTWKNIKSRCYDPKANNYRWYGGAGVSVYEPWRTNAGAFIDWIEANLGAKPEGCTLDRIDPFGDYEPGNLRWATHSEQRRNRRPRQAG